MKKKRLILNFGHTFAHSIEMSTENLTKEYYRHGEAVGIEFCVNCFIKPKKNILLETVKNLLRDYNLPTKIDKGDFVKKKNILLEHIYKNIYLDKKKISRFPRYIFMKKIHKPEIKELQNHDLILETINNFI